MDLTIEVMPLAPGELARAPAGEPSAAVAARVQAARERQRARYGEGGPVCNAEAEARHLHPTLEAEVDRLLETAVARSIADLAASEPVQRAHVAEALAFRHRIPGRSAVVAA